MSNATKTDPPIYFIRDPEPMQLKPPNRDFAKGYFAASFVTVGIIAAHFIPVYEFQLMAIVWGVASSYYFVIKHKTGGA